jgi:osmoprotectant transport system substrate-binding protein
MTLTHTLRRGALAALLVPTLALGLAACGSDDSDSGSSGAATTAASTTASADAALPGKGKPTVTLGTKDFTEEFVLGELYKQALEAKGYTVKLKKNIGSTEIIDKALTSNQIDAYPEYVGVSLATVAGKDIKATSAQQTYDLAKEFYEGRGQTLSAATPFADVDAVATKKAYATKHNLKSVADLKGAGTVKIAGGPEFKSRYQGLRGLQQVYKLSNLKFKQVAQGVQYEALDSGAADASNVFSTDAQLASGKYTVLTDPKGIFGYQNVALVIDQKKLAALGGDAFLGVVDGVSKLLTNDAMIAMNKAVATDKQPEATVAAAFLKANGVV